MAAPLLPRWPRIARNQENPYDQPAHQRPAARQLTLYESPARMLTYAQAAELLAVTSRTVRRRAANGQYVTYGEGPGKRVLLLSIMQDIGRAAGEPS